MSDPIEAVIADLETIIEELEKENEMLKARIEELETIETKYADVESAIYDIYKKM